MRPNSLSTRLPVAIALIAFPLLSAACQEQTAPDSPGIQAARGGNSGGKGGGGGGGGGGNGGGSDPTVTDARPSHIPQGLTVDLEVDGTDFDDGSTVELLIDGQSTREVKTNFTTFQSPTRLIANVSVDADADLELYDIEVTTSRKKKGIGADLVEVIEGPVATLPSCVLAGSGCDTDPTVNAPGVYDDGKGNYAPFGSDGDVVFASNGNLRLHPRCESEVGRRDMFIVLPESTPTDDWTLSGPPSTCNGKKGAGFVRLQIPGLYSATDGPIGDDPQPPDYSPSVFYYFVADSNGDGKYALPHDDAYNVVWTDAHVEVLDTRLESDGTLTPIEWRVTGSATEPAGEAQLYLRPGDQPGQPQATGTVELDLIVRLNE